MLFSVFLKIGDPFSNDFLPIYKLASLLEGAKDICWVQMTFMHHIITEELRLEETSRCLLVQLACSSRATQSHSEGCPYYLGLEYPQELRLSHLLRNPAPALGHPQQEAFLLPEEISSVSVCVHSHILCHWLVHPQKEPGSIIFAPSL